MTNKEKQLIYNDERYFKIIYENGIIVTKWSLIELRKKRLNQLFKNQEWHIRPSTLTEFLMYSVYILYRRYKSKERFMISRGYKKVRDERGNTLYVSKDYDND